MAAASTASAPAVDAAVAIVRMRAGSLLSLDDAVWAQFAEAAECTGLDSDHTAPGRLLATAPNWIAARRAILAAKSSRASCSSSIMGRLGLGRPASGAKAGGATLAAAAASVGSLSLVHPPILPIKEAADMAAALHEQLQAQADAAGGSSAQKPAGAVPTGRGRGAAARAKRRRAADQATEKLKSAIQAPAVPLLELVGACANNSASADDTAAAAADSASKTDTPDYAMWRRALLGRRFERLRRWAEDTALQKMAAEAMQRALQAEREEIGRWLESDAEDSSDEEQDDDDAKAGDIIDGHLGDAVGSLRPSLRGDGHGRGRAGSGASMSGMSVSGGTGGKRKLRGKTLRLGVGEELRHWEVGCRFQSAAAGGGAGGGEEADGIASASDGLTAEETKEAAALKAAMMRLPPPPSALPTSSLAAERARADASSASQPAGGAFGTVHGSSSAGALDSALAAGIPVPVPIASSCTAAAFSPGKATSIAAALPIEPVDSGAGPWRTLRGPGDGDLLAVATAGASSSHGPSLQLLDTLSGQRVSLLEGHTEAVSALSWDRTGSYLLSCGLDGQVRLWSIRAPKYVWDESRIKAATAKLLAARAATRSPEASSGGSASTVIKDSTTERLSGSVLRGLLRPRLRAGAANCVRLLVRESPVTHGCFFPGSSNLFLIVRAVKRQRTLFEAATGSAEWRWAGLLEVVNVSTGHSTQQLETVDVVTALCFGRNGTTLFWADVRGRTCAVDVGAAALGGMAGTASGGGAAGGKSVFGSSRPGASSASALASGSATIASAAGEALIVNSVRVLFEQRMADARTRQLLRERQRLATTTPATAGSGTSVVGSTGHDETPTGSATGRGTWEHGGSGGGGGGGSVSGRMRAGSHASSTGRRSRGASLSGMRASPGPTDALGTAGAGGGIASALALWGRGVKAGGSKQRARGLAFDNDISDSVSVLSGTAGGGGGDDRSVASWGDVPRDTTASGTASASSWSGRAAYLVRLEHRPYDTLLRTEGLIAVDACGRRRCLCLCPRGAELDVVLRAKEAGVVVLGLGGSAAVNGAAMAEAALLHPLAYGSTSAASDLSRAAVSAARSTSGQAVLKPWQMGGKSKPDKVVIAGAGVSGSEASKGAGGFSLFGRRRRHVAGAGAVGGSGSTGTGGPQGCVEVGAWRARKASDPLLIGSVGGAASCVGGSDCVAVGSPDGDIGIVDPYSRSASGAVVARLRAHVRSVTSLTWASEDARLATGDDGGSIVIWEHPLIG